MATIPPDYDSLSKELLSVALGHDGFGEAHPNHPVPSPAQYVDVYFVPSGQATASPPVLELLHRMGATPSLFEAFRKTPEEEEVVDVLDKALTAHRDQRPRDRGERRSYQRPHLFLLSPGSPDKSLASSWSRPDNEVWEEGFYLLPPILDGHIVVIDQLPRSEGTLPLRLLGRGETQRAAIEELRAMGAQPLQEMFVDILLRWRLIEVRKPRHERDDASTELIMNTRQLLEEERRHWREEGKEEGLEKGLDALAHLYQRRLGRPLSKTERDTLRQRLLSLGPDRVGDVVLDMAPAELEDWLAREDAT